MRGLGGLLGFFRRGGDLGGLQAGGLLRGDKDGGLRFGLGLRLGGLSGRLRWRGGGGGGGRLHVALSGGRWRCWGGSRGLGGGRSNLRRSRRTLTPALSQGTGRGSGGS